MKKTLAILLALVAIGGVAFAQVKIGGYVRTVYTASTDGVAFANRLRLNLSYDAEDGTYGIFARLQNANKDAPTVPYAQGYVNLLDKQLTITSGILGVYDYDVGTGLTELNNGNLSNQGYELDSTKAFLVQIKPAAVEGLNLGVAYEFDANAVYGAAKFGSDAFSVVANGHYAIDSNAARASLTVGLTPVEGLSVNVGGKYNMGVADYKSTTANAITPFAIIDYGTDAMTIEVAPAYVLYTDNSSTNEIYVESSFSYKVADPLTVYLFGDYDSTKDVLGSTYMAGIEANYKVGKATLDAAFIYDESGWSMPCYTKFSF